MPNLEEDGPNDVDLLFQQDGGPPHFALNRKCRRK